ncbi:hypothetical protein BIW11_02270 [Tropilaelaps mercedesae]|uniref:Uncharacterized protein n=1 Tax=Tropilaelaps mercedesae TaxID=418985 RepID=A0A1V9X076_9ACAR|nr:hypothetical protein BIW11_02270 [Tropilaelaps mercedesae]
MDVSLEEKDEVFDPIPLQPLLRLRRTPERAVFEDLVRQKEIKLVTLIKPEIILYTTHAEHGRTVHCMELTGRKPEGITKNGYIYRFRNAVVSILNLSFEHRVRVGFLLGDGTMYISMVRQGQSQDRFEWMRCGQIRNATFDLSQAQFMVYSRTADALFWPQHVTNSSEGKWDLQMYSVRNRTQITILREVPEMELEAMKDELVVLFRRHGALFLEYRQMRPSRNYSGYGVPNSERQQVCLSRNEHHSGHLSDQADSLLQRTSLRHNDSGISLPYEDILEAPDTSLTGVHWSPEMIAFELIDNLNGFQPKQTEVELRGHCHCKDQRQKHQDLQRRIVAKQKADEGIKRVIAMYGSVVYKLTAHTCTPLTTVRVPSDLDEPFNLMYLSRIVVLYNHRIIAGYMNSLGPVKIRKGEFLLAGYGIVVYDEGIFRIKMSLPRSLESEE